MYRAAPAMRVASSGGRGAVRITRRRITSDTPIITPVAPPKKSRTLRKLVLGTAAAAGTFYVGSTFVAFNNDAYYDFFSDQVPLGQPMLEYAEAQKWDTLTASDVIEKTTDTAVGAYRYAQEKISGIQAPAKSTLEVAREKAQEVQASAAKAAKEAKEKALSVAETVKTEVKKAGDHLPTATTDNKTAAQNLTEEATNLVKKAEDAIAGVIPADMTAAITRATPEDSPEPTAAGVSSSDKSVYNAPLPVGFEPPPGYARPAPPKKKEADVVPPTPAPELPRVLPDITALAGSEPIVTHLAEIIDNLSSYLHTHPEASSKITPVLEGAKLDLSNLVTRVEQVKEDERHTLEAKMDEQTREYNTKILEIEMEAQDRLDNQEEDFRKFHDGQKQAILHAYTDKLNSELQTQADIINQRLKEEVIAQGIELQRRWIRDVKVHVEEERGGRLAKIDELSTQLKRLERVALDNSVVLDENIRVHGLWSAIRAVSANALSAPTRKPFREELRVLRHVAAARDDEVVSSSLATLDASSTPDIGIEPLADLSSWFSTSVAPRISSVALVPETNAGLLSHLASHAFSTLTFKRQGLVQGSDVLSIVARAEHYLTEKNLDMAARELNQLRGTAGELVQDWLAAARRRLEVEQALEVVQIQATLASLLVV